MIAAAHHAAKNVDLDEIRRVTVVSLARREREGEHEDNLLLIRQDRGDTSAAAPAGLQPGGQ